MVGAHNVLNALAVVAVADELGIPLDIVRAGARRLRRRAAALHGARRGAAASRWSTTTAITRPRCAPRCAGARERVRPPAWSCAFQPHRYTPHPRSAGGVRHAPSTTPTCCSSPTSTPPARSRSPASRGEGLAEAVRAHGHRDVVHVDRARLAAAAHERVAAGRPRHHPGRRRHHCRRAGAAGDAGIGSSLSPGGGEGWGREVGALRLRAASGGATLRADGLWLRSGKGAGYGGLARSHRAPGPRRDPPRRPARPAHRGPGGRPGRPPRPPRWAGRPRRAAAGRPRAGRAAPRAGRRREPARRRSGRARRHREAAGRLRRGVEPGEADRPLRRRALVPPHRPGSEARARRLRVRRGHPGHAGRARRHERGDPPGRDEGRPHPGRARHGRGLGLGVRLGARPGLPHLPAAAWGGGDAPRGGAPAGRRRRQRCHHEGRRGPPPCHPALRPAHLRLDLPQPAWRLRWPAHRGGGAEGPPGGERAVVGGPRQLRGEPGRRDGP